MKLADLDPLAQQLVRIAALPGGLAVDTTTGKVTGLDEELTDARGTAAKSRGDLGFLDCDHALGVIEWIIRAAHPETDDGR